VFPTCGTWHYTITLVEGHFLNVPEKIQRNKKLLSGSLAVPGYVIGVHLCHL
jgi:hypothetical protein